MTEIDKIRMKYKRGIRFVQNDQDEQQQTTGDTQQAPESDQQDQNVGAYNEFLPEREIVVYQTSGRPDPFMPLIEDATSAAGEGNFPMSRRCVWSAFFRTRKPAAPCSRITTAFPTS